MGSVGIMPRLIADLLAISLVTLCCDTEPALGRPPAHGTRKTSWLGSDSVSPNLPKTVSVRCRESELEIAVEADLYNIGTPIEGCDLRLGADPGVRDSCRAQASGPSSYTIIAGLEDCGTQRLVTEDSLIYANLLVYSPKASRMGIVRMKGVAIPIECRYRRRVRVDSDILTPTWMPAPSVPPGDLLGFSLKLMSSDWRAERASSSYVLGDILHIQASVQSDSRAPLSLFLDSCVATLLPDRSSVPRYAFLENNGCLIDAMLTGSGSMFLPRVQQPILQFWMETFAFPLQTTNTMYITCHMVAAASGGSLNPKQRACSFVDGRWRSADGNDWVCSGCDVCHRFGQPIWSMGPGSHQRPAGTSPLGWETEMTVGPMTILPRVAVGGPVFPKMPGPAWPPGVYGRPDMDSVGDWQKDSSSDSIDDDDLSNTKDGEFTSKPKVLRREDFGHPVLPSHQGASLGQKLGSDLQRASQMLA